MIKEVTERCNNWFIFFELETMNLHPPSQLQLGLSMKQVQPCPIHDPTH